MSDLLEHDIDPMVTVFMNVARRADEEPGRNVARHGLIGQF
ncbi:hypothetical protein [Silvimonas amylolytica]|nr:hypothetical protein [Silvimonas amylolytica]